MNLLECTIKENKMLVDETKQIFCFIHPMYWIDPDRYVETHTFNIEIYKN